MTDPNKLKALSERATAGPWSACKEGKCSCGMIWSKAVDAPIITCEKGEWGDSYPSLRTVGADGHPVPLGSPGARVEAYIALDAYGKLPDDCHEHNAAFIVALVNAYRDGSLTPAQPTPEQGRVEELEKALEPFAEQADARNLNASDEDFMRISIDVHVGDLRRARQALNTGDKNETADSD